MSFAVDLSSLREVPRMLDRLTQDAVKCRQYAEIYFNFALGPGILNRITGRHAEARQQVVTLFSELEKRVSNDRDNVANTIASYEAADLRAAAELDAALPKVELGIDSGRSPILRPDFLQARVSEQARPSEALVEPPDYSLENPYQPQWSDLVSPGNLARDAVWGMTWLATKIGLSDRAYDPLDDVVLPLTGNWAGMHACSDALTHLSEATRRLQANVDWITLRVEATWLGNAADAYWSRLRALSATLPIVQRGLLELSDQYLAVVESMKALEEPVEAIVIDLIDAAVFATAAVASAETGVGPAVFGSATVYEIIKVVQHVNDLLSLIGKANNGIDAFNGKMSSLGMLGDNIPDLPTVPA